jgi:hypothetical protein
VAAPPTGHRQARLPLPRRLARLGRVPARGLDLHRLLTEQRLGISTTLDVIRGGQPLAIDVVPAEARPADEPGR